MTAAKAQVFGPPTSYLVNRNEVAHQYTSQRVTDHSERFLFLHERVSTPARVFSSFRFLAHNVDAMAKEPAAVINLLLEFAIGRIRVAGCREEQRMTAPLANVFIVGRSAVHCDIMMPT